ncbi:helix-turn-helix domain-containing protein [Sphingobium chlorophenolicum]|uniref:Transcriptional regulator, y4mF family n=1 Tax=Sphingobium chlorophenolicum TaxID=46429 RepID=A0A081RCY7_SPHCR|nr:helix-turn-helix domain-containing protein [Sphingobium chlorophenolicum]KEQ53060.1 transcriptional regulator, y4mF family [Sphingobium chlorophenolicum]
MANEQRCIDASTGMAGFGAQLRSLRRNKLGLTQRGFAERYNLGPRTIRDLEQGVTNPTPAMRLIVAAIDRDPGGMEEAAIMAAKPSVTV